MMNIHLVTSVEQIMPLVKVYSHVFAQSPYNENWATAESVAHFEEVLRNGRGICLFAEEDGEQIGLILSRFFVWHDGMRVFIEDLFVHPDHQKKGVGKKLVAALELAAREHKCVALDLLTQKEADSVAFYEKQNFKPTGYIQMSKSITSLGMR